MAETNGQDQARYVWEPQERQAEALACPAFELFFGGAKGGGKSDFLLGDWLQNVSEWGKAWRGVIFRRTYKELEELVSRSQDIYSKIEGAHFVGGEQMMWHIPAPHARFPGDATLRFRALESKLDVGKYNGHQYPWIGFDELTEFEDPEPYLFMIKCCRSPYGAPTFIRATGNPGRPGHVWVKARFIDVAKPYEIYTYAPNPKQPDKVITRCFIPSRLEDNQILMRNDPSYETRLMDDAPHLVRALRFGDWDIVVGQVLSEYSSERHVLRQIPLDRSWYRFASLDWGFAKPFSIGWWAINEDGRMIRYKEWYGSSGKPNEGLRMGAKEVAKKAWDMSVAEGVTKIVADPACWSKMDESDSIADSFAKAGFEMIKANNDRINGLQKLHEMMQSNGADGKPYLLIMETCRDWIRTVPYLTADPRNPEDINTAMEDHAYDDTRYAIMSEFAKNPRALRTPDRLRATNTRMPYNPLTYGL